MMRRTQFSLLALLGGMTYVAINLAALANASGLMASVAVLANHALLLAALLGVFVCRGANRAFAGGFALFGWSYLLLCYFPVSDRYTLKETMDELLKPVRELVLQGGASSRPTLHDFLFVGHVWLAVIFGLLGGYVGRSLYKRRSNN